MAPRPVPSPLFHYTCTHGELAILSDGGMIRPGPDGVVWLTDMARPNRDALGLTMNFIHCDRIAHRFTVPNTAAVLWWPEFRRAATREWHAWARVLEEAPGARPAHWYVSEIPLRGFPDGEDSTT